MTMRPWIAILAATAGMANGWGCSGKSETKRRAGAEPMQGVGGVTGSGHTDLRVGATVKAGGSNPSAIVDSVDIAIDTPQMLLPGEADEPPCASTSVAAQPVETEKEIEVPVEIETRSPVAIYLMLDRSSSMIGQCRPEDPCNPLGWIQATSAITSFVSSPDSEGLDVALGYFPPRTGEPSCDGATCETPAVPIAPLPENAQPINQSLVSSGPAIMPPLYTPTECALRGMVGFCRKHMADTGEECVGVLISDGAPSECSEATDQLAQIAADGLAQDGVLTFSLGMVGADFAVLDAIATAGGTDCEPDGPHTACNVTAGEGALIAALNTIRDTVTVTTTRTEIVKEVVFTVVECEWLIPDPGKGEIFDPEQVNVSFTSGQGPTVAIGKVPSAAACSEFSGGWHFDDEAAPTKVVACPETCAFIQAQPDSRVDLAFGCKTILSVPR
ncbi:hypothetical protein ACFL5O_05065 [Myxococcota bacterium]